MSENQVIKKSEVLAHKETAEEYAHVIKQILLSVGGDEHERIFEKWCKAFNLPSTYEQAMEECYKHEDMDKTQLVEMADMLWEATLEEYETWNSYANGYVFKDLNVYGVKL